ncbi:MAG: lysine--tRNA ligase [Patescibacteria group bacterium]
MLEDIIKERRKKLDNLIGAGINPYPEKTKKNFSNKKISDNFEQLLDKNIVIAGRVRSLRSMGAITFLNIDDESGRIQALLKKEHIGEEQYQLFVENLDIGDFIQAEGILFLTKTKEKTLNIDSLNILTKSLLPIPTEYYGLKDKEALLRKRYLDLIINSEMRELFRKKNIFWQTIRNFLIERDFLEVDTPVLETAAAGADAKPFITHHNVLDCDFYLRISLELPLKKLLVGGYEKVFEIGKVFRNEGIDAEHLQDYLMMEFYWAYADMESGMKLTKELFKKIIFSVSGGYETEYDNNKIKWDGEWEVVDYFDSFKKETGIDLSQNINMNELKKKADELNLKYEPSYGKGRMIDLIYKKTVRPKLIQPCFLTGHPVEVSPLAKKDPNNQKKVLRFQIIAAGSELANGFSELNDPIDQRARFEEQSKLRQAGDEEAQMMDDDFIEALEYGMPPAVGVGISERLFSFIMNRSIRETVIFPLMRKK